MRLMRAWMTHGTAVVMGVTSRSVRSVASQRRRAAASGSRTTARSSSCRALMPRTVPSLRTLRTGVSRHRGQSGQVLRPGSGTACLTR
jgi:hypothetical protein